MFDIGWGELVVIGIVALIVIGPKELPTVLRTVGQWATKIRRMASEFQGQFQEAMREAEFADLKKQVDSIGDSARDLTTGGFDPLGTAKKEIEGVFEEKPPTPAGDAPATSPPEQTTVTAEAAPSAGNEPAPAEPTAASVASADPFGPPPDLPPPVTERDFIGESASTGEKPSPPHPEAGGGRAA